MYFHVVINSITSKKILFKLAYKESVKFMLDKLIIFDMDNTILCSSIDFDKMLVQVHSLLRDAGFVQYCRQSVADTILTYTDSAECDKQLVEQLWKCVAKLEDEGLYAARLEPGAAEALEYLSQYAVLTVLTNNTDNNLAQHLGRLGALPYLSCVAGRDSVGRLKPAPDGMQWVMAHYPDIPISNVIAVGDAWNDAAAAAAAGIRFAAYNNSRDENWAEHGIVPRVKLTNWDKNSCELLLCALNK